MELGHGTTPAPGQGRCTRPKHGAQYSESGVAIMPREGTAAARAILSKRHIGHRGVVWWVSWTWWHLLLLLLILLAVCVCVCVRACVSYGQEYRCAEGGSVVNQA